MNIFFLSAEPKQCAEWHCDKHILKMSVEYGQLLSSAIHVLQPNHDWDDVLYKRAFVNHPCAKWTRENVTNYVWLATLFEECLNEYAARYGRQHKARILMKPIWETDFIRQAKEPLPQFSPPPLCMPTNFVATGENDPVKRTLLSYRNYYNGPKSKFATWKIKEHKPWWFRASKDGGDNG